MKLYVDKKSMRLFTKDCNTVNGYTRFIPVTPKENDPNYLYKFTPDFPETSVFFIVDVAY